MYAPKFKWYIHHTSYLDSWDPPFSLLPPTSPGLLLFPSLTELEAKSAVVRVRPRVYEAQVLRFGDRLFYRDWWNANTIEAYWRLWNLPVHYWMVRVGTW